MPYTQSGLPDPALQPGFYDGVTLKRALAWLIDSVIIGMLAILFSLFTFGIGFFFFPLIFLTISIVYRIGTIASGSGTWGMRFLGIEVRNAQGHRLSSGEAALHTIFYLLSLMFFIPQIASWAMMLFSERGQGLHDALLGTAVINRPQ